MFASGDIHSLWYVICFLFQALSEISSGTTDAIVLDIESIDFDEKDKDIDEVIKKIQKDIETIQIELQFCRNLKGKLVILFALS